MREDWNTPAGIEVSHDRKWATIEKVTIRKSEVHLKMPTHAMLLSARQNPLAVSQVGENRFRIADGSGLDVEMIDERTDRDESIFRSEMLHGWQLQFRGGNAFRH